MSAFEVVKIGLEVFFFLVSGGVGVYAYLVSRNTASQEKVSALESALQRDIAELRAQVGRLDERSRQSPTHSDLEQVYRRIDQVAQTVNSMAGAFEGTQRTLNLIHDYLLQGKG